ncbi:carotenoid biosynthesis protein [Evansella tamaricis]|uniref:Carotenoid biosynthesis protein n=1 Tax=Evansella tamaricis TaxID=2069301 RepID=A0ABS6JME0_9BACI|nr:carotenoid biosynthesis protein [Evansella tamaricis]MBU9714746.1 carotenoid biosynthesis protein [Evansella tamaricis]
MSPTIDQLIFRFFLFWYVCGTVLLTFDILPQWLEWANIVFLVTTGLLAILYFTRQSNYPTNIIIIGSVFFLTMFMEGVGVKTGLFFGEYDYKSDFGPKLFGVPITIGFAWMMVIATSQVLASPLLSLLHTSKIKGLLFSLYGAFIATSLDLIIDPVAFHVKEYWIWHESGFYYDIPLSNFSGWFILSFILHYFIYILLPMDALSKPPVKRSYWRQYMVYLYGMIMLMFILIAMMNQLYIASTISSFALLLVYYSYYSLEKWTVKKNDNTEKAPFI